MLTWCSDLAKHSVRSVAVLSLADEGSIVRVGGYGALAGPSFNTTAASCAHSSRVCQLLAWDRQIA
eukprot:2794752-Rhodomonas_salina.1